ncbi:LruC domain-containing protein [Vibrio sp. RE86]|uniref:LruC domain-containing protein n=1 Tax=Vibrio sp. RE86 TaxID=2607605 RepID=UPI00149356FC|nr:LruC domain-containing protein [Vibrio sp. RE86]NOH81953.1 LruC domain-containing protein [Vibrio sp. RE86]
MKIQERTILITTASAIALTAIPVAAETPFTSCPTQAFLIQNPSGAPVAYGVNIDVGSYVTLDSTLGTSKLNAVGYSKHDDFIYGWDYDNQTLSRLDADFGKTILTITKPSGTPGSIYVGDVALDENAWYGYRPSYGLYRVDLDTLVMELSSPSGVFGNPSIYDLAFHPSNGLAYSIDATGYLWEIDVSAGTSTRLNQVLNRDELGYRFTFGAVYFDVDGNFYASNNSNGYVFKVTIDDLQSTAEFFAYGPSSNSNDGARCALAPVEPSEYTDFGDAPDSYKTTFAASGARHGLSDLKLGSVIDGETDGSPYPLSDDLSDGSDDDDGIQFPVPIQVGNTSKIIATALGTSSGSVLNAWIDFDRDGEFESNEQIIDDQALTDSTHDVFFTVPTWAIAGETWARFRISNTSGIGPSGGVPAGEVEDYLIDVTESGVSTQTYPTGGGFTTFAYEDQYPLVGDYDMNDVLMNVKYTEYQLNNQVIRMKIEGKVAALGGDYHSGFAIRLPDVAREDIKEDSVELIVNNVSMSGTVLESDTTDAVFIIHEDLWDITEPGEAEACSMFRTQENCGTTYRPTWSLTFSLENAVGNDVMPDFPYDPFIFAAPGHYYGDIGHQVSGGYPGRALEIHLKNQSPTSKFDNRYKSYGVDASSGNTHYHNANGLPWGIEVPTDWKHPMEQKNILQAYSEFAQFSLDSSGQTQPTWYMSPNNNFIYVD